MQDSVVRQGANAIPTRAKIVFDSVFVLFMVVACSAATIYWLLAGRYALGLTLAAATIILNYMPIKAVFQDMQMRSRAQKSDAKLTVVK